MYDTFETNETMLNTLKTGKSDYDLVCPSEYMIQKLATEGRIQKLDQTKLTGYNEKLSGFRVRYDYDDYLDLTK